MFDVVCATLGLILLTPVFAIIAAAIKWEDGGPIIYSQMRVGKNLGKFRLFKFRSMFFGASDSTLLTAPQDSRVTRIGRFLRKHKLDELPQLINVLKGEMQLVGVRPQMDRFVGAFPSEYRILLQDRPGIADVASLIFRNEEQLLGPGSSEEQELHYIKKILPRKLHLSLEYRRARTFLSDVGILVRTVLAILSSATRWPRRNSDRFRLPSAKPQRRWLKECTDPACFTVQYPCQPGSHLPSIQRFHFSTLESDPFHQNDELDRIHLSP